MITINQVVLNKKGQKGTITRIITKSTGYVEVTYENGSVKKEMAFNLTDENGISLKNKSISETSGLSKGEKKRRKDAEEIAAFEKLSPLQQTISRLQDMNNCVNGDRSSLTYRIPQEMVFKIEKAAEKLNNSFIVSVCQSVDKYMKCSDKQAYYLAKFAIDNQVEF